MSNDDWMSILWSCLIFAGSLLGFIVGYFTGKNIRKLINNTITQKIDYKDIIKRANAKIFVYQLKYKKNPNAILINKHELDKLKEESFKILSQDYKDNIDKKNYYQCELLGLKVIPIKEGEMEVVELV